MKKLYKFLFAGLMALACGVSGSAQDLRSGYFVENYNYRFTLNPAFGNEKGFFSMPALGNLNIGVNGNLHLNSIVYNYQGRTVLFTNPGLSAGEVLGNFKDVNKLNFDFKETVLAFGFKGFKGYNTVSLNIVSSANISVPKSLFSLIKEGVTNRTYDIEDVRARANGYAELALNHSHDMSKVLPGLRVGGTAKFLIGLGNIDAKFNNAKLTLGQDNWIAQTDAELYTSIKGAKYEHDFNETTGHEYVSGIDVDNFKPSGFGVAFDLGAEYKWTDFNFSLALLNIGAISYSNTQFATTNGLQKVETDGYIFNVDNDASNSFSNELDRLTDNLASLYELNDKGDIGSRSVWLPTTLNVGVDYELPYFRKLHFGLLNTTCFAGPFKTTDFRLSANICPIKQIGLSANVNAGTYGTGFGWLFNLAAPGFNLFLGMDKTPTKLAKQGVPLKSNAQFTLGMDFTF